MEEFEKWLESEAANATFGSMWEAVDKYKKMACKFQWEGGESDFEKCSGCGFRDYMGSAHGNYCPNCGRKVQNDG